MESINQNEYILASPVILFTGAGASAPLGLKTTKEFLPYVKESMEGKDHSELPLNKGYDYWESALDDLYRAVATKTSTTLNQIDSEMVLDYLDDYEDACELIKTGPAGIFQLLQGATSPGIVQPVQQACIEVRNVLRNHIVQHYAEVNVDLVRNLYQEVIGRLIEINSSSSGGVIYTTNYDWVPESISAGLSLNLIDGFPPEGGNWNREIFTNFAPGSSKNLIVFRLHGSTAWRRYKSGRIVKINEVEYNPGTSVNHLIYPTSRPKAFGAEPFKTMYEHLRLHLARASLCIIIGFSFRDREVTEIFREGLSSNSNLKLLLIDPAINEESEIQFNGLLQQLHLNKKEWAQKIHVAQGNFSKDWVEEYIIKTASDYLNWNEQRGWAKSFGDVLTS